MFNVITQLPSIFYLTATLLFTLPWLNPFAPGPSPSVAPWLFSMAIGALLLLIFSWLSAGHSGFPRQLTIETKQAFGTSLLIAGLISSVLALLQYFDVESLFAPWVNAAEPGQAFANLRQRNQFASLTNMALAALLVWALHSKPGALTRQTVVTALAGAAVLVMGNAASASRTGVVQMLLLCVIFALWGGWPTRLSRMVRFILLGAVVTYALAAVALPYIAGFDWSVHGMAARLRDGDASCASRLTLWSNVLHLIAQKPWFGWGWGELDYAHFITLYEGPRFCEILDNAHNLPLQLAVELGVPFALLVCGVFGWWVLRQKPWAERDAMRQMAWAVIAVILLHSMLEYPLWYGPFQMAFGLCVLLLWRQKSSQEVKNSSKSISNMPIVLVLYALTAIFLIAFIFYAAWDYRRISQIYLPPESRDAYYRSDTLNKIRNSWLFADQVRFAELMVTPLTPSNAAWTFNTASALLHYSPEPRVVERLIESAVMRGRDDDAIAYLARFRLAFPVEHAAWVKANGKSIAIDN